VKKKVLLIIVAVVCLAALVACAAPAPAPAPAPKPTPTPRELIYHHHGPKTTFMAMESYGSFIVSRMNELTKGELKIVEYGGGELVEAKDVYEAVRDGAIPMGCGVTPYESGTWRLMNFFELPFFFKKPEMSDARAIWHRLYDEMLADYARNELGVVFLKGGWFTAEFDLWSTKPIRSLEDMHGMKIEVPGAIASAGVVAFGGTPVALVSTEIYPSIQRGTVDGVMIQAFSVQDFKLDELVKYGTILGFWGMGGTYIVNPEVWDSFTDSQREALHQASLDAEANLASKHTAKTQEAYRQLLELGIELIGVSPTEKARWENASKSVWDEWEADRGAEGTKILAIAREMRGS